MRSEPSQTSHFLKAHLWTLRYCLQHMSFWRPFQIQTTKPWFINAIKDLGYKCAHHGLYQAASMISLTTELGRDRHSWLSWVCTNVSSLPLPPSFVIECSIHFHVCFLGIQPTWRILGQDSWMMRGQMERKIMWRRKEAFSVPAPARLPAECSCRSDPSQHHITWSRRLPRQLTGIWGIISCCGWNPLHFGIVY